MPREYTVEEFRAGKVPGTVPLIDGAVTQAPHKLIIHVPVRLESEANRRDHWAKKAARLKKQRAMVALVLRFVRGAPVDVSTRLTVTITRIAPRELDTDNLAGSTKAVRDEIAMWLGVDDGPRGPVTWTYEQRAEGKLYGCEIVVRW